MIVEGLKLKFIIKHGLTSSFRYTCTNNNPYLYEALVFVETVAVESIQLVSLKM